MSHGYARPPRPLSQAKRVEAFVTEIVQDALEDGLVELCASQDGTGQGYRLTPKGEEWVRSLPPCMLDCAPRSFQGESRNDSK